MRSIFIILFCAVMFSCKKDTEINKGPYLGKWELTYTVGIGITNYPVENGNTLIFGNDGNLIKTVLNDDTSYSISDKYRLEKGAYCGTPESPATILYFGKGSAEIVSIEDTLFSVTSTECYSDKFVFVYRKIN